MNTISIPTLADSAMLMYVKISVWSARKLDKKQSQKTVKDAGATADAARVNKHLLAEADAKLRAVQRKAGEIRTYVETNSLPWDDAGNRLVTNDRALLVVGEAHKLVNEFNDLVNEFVAEYPVLRAQALANLGNMADESDYPQPDVVRSKFSVRLSFNPLAVGFGDARMGMTEQQAQAWQAQFEGNVRRQVTDALHAAWSRLKEDLARYSDRLKLRDDGSGKMEIFRDTMVTNLRETLSLLTSLNVFGDDDLTNTAAEVNRLIAVYEPDQLRSSQTLAEDVKDKVDDVLQRMEGFLL